MPLFDQSKSEVAKKHPDFFCFAKDQYGEVGIFLSEAEKKNELGIKYRDVWKANLDAEVKAAIKQKSGLDLDV